MRKRLLCMLLCGTVVLGMCLSGCSGKKKEDPKETVKKTVLASLKLKAEDFTELLEDGIAETDANNGFALSLPGEAKEEYLYFLSTAYSKVKMEISSIDEKEDGYIVRVGFDPLNVALSLQGTEDAYMESMTSTDQVQAISGLLTQGKKALKEDAVYDDRAVVDFTVKKKESSYTVSKEDVQKVKEAALTEYMQPYELVNGVLDIQDYITAYLDAAFKGEFEEFMIHTGMTQEEAQEWYEGGGIFDAPEDMSEAYRDRFAAACKGILKQCKYSVGVPQKQPGKLVEYAVDVTVTPNLGFMNAWEEFQNGAYPDIDSASAAFVEAMEKYAAASAFDEEEVVGVELNMASFVSEKRSDVDMLIEEICPLPH